MPIRVVVTRQIERYVACPPAEVEAGDLRGALEEVFACTPKLRSYVVDERGRLRKHVRLFVNGAAADGLDQRLSSGDEVYVMQSLTGG